MYQRQLRRIIPTILTAVERLQGTTVEILRPGQEDSGVIQLIQTKDGKRAAFHSAVLLLLQLFGLLIDLEMVGLSTSAFNGRRPYPYPYMRIKIKIDKSQREYMQLK